MPSNPLHAIIPRPVLGKARRSLHDLFVKIPGYWNSESRFLRIMASTRWKHADDPEVLLSQLRVATHAVDKSLHAVPWTKGRGKRQYDLCRSLIDRLRDTPVRDDPSFLWACAKVEEYETAQEQGPPGSADYRPGCADEADRERVLAFLKERRSIRSFEPRSIERDVLDQLFEAANWAPSSCCRQSLFLHATQNHDLVQKCLEQCAGATCFSESTPCFVAACGDLRFYDIRDRNVPYIDATFGVQNMLLAAHAFGIEGTVLNWMHRTRAEERELRRLLDIPDYHEIMFNIAMGYPSQAAPAPGRKGPALTYRMH